MKKIDWIILACFVLVSVFTLKDLFKPDFYTSHDGTHQIARLYYFDQAVRDGQIPPRWAGGLNHGFGYPLFLFSYHAPWFIGEPLHLAGLSIIDSVKMTFLIGYLLSGITMYLFLHKMTGRLPAVVGTWLYLFAPYRFSNIFVRAAIGDATTFVFVPLFFLSLYLLHTKGKLQWPVIALGSFAFAGMLLSHAMVFFLFALAAGVYGVYWLILSPNRNTFLISSIMVGLLGLGLSAYYFIPSLIERENTKFTAIMGSTFTGNTFVPFEKLLYSPWGYGAINSPEGAMSVQFGIVQWVTLALAALTLIWKLITKPRDTSVKHMAVFMIIVALSILAMLPVSLPVWKVINGIALVDFTWRILAVSVFAAAVLGAYCIRMLPGKMILAGFLMLLAVYSNRNHTRINEAVTWPLEFLLKLEKTTNSYDEYTPKWVNEEVIGEDLPLIVLGGEGNQVVREYKSNRLSFTVDTDSASKAKIRTIYYPGWEASRNGKKIEIEKANGLMQVNLVSGRNDIDFVFNETPLRKTANVLTLVSIGVVLFLLVKYKKV